MQHSLPATTNFVRQTERNGCFEGEWPIAKLERLTPLLNSNTGVIHARLQFGDRAGIPCIRGEVSAVLDMNCQRCNQPIRQPVAGSFLFALMHSEAEIGEIPEDMEPYLLVGEEQSIIDILEDELLLSLPLVSAHNEDCSEYLREQDKRLQTEKMASSPFAALKKLMSD